MTDSRIRPFIQWTGYAVSLVAALICSIVTEFNIYALSIKETFQYTQSEVELIASLGAAGMSLCILQPILTSWRGYQVTYVIALVLAPIACLLVYMGTLYPVFFSQWPFLIGLFLFLANWSSRMFQLQIFQIGVNNFDKKYSGKIIGLYSGLLNLGKMLFCGLYDIYLNNNLGKVFVILAVVYAVNLSLCMVLHRPISKKDEIMSFNNTANLDLEKRIVETSNNRNKRTGEEDISADLSRERELEKIGVKVMFKSSYFHLMFWSSVVFYSAYCSFGYNITTIGHSAGLNNPFVSVYIVSVTKILSRLLVGPIYDFFQSDKHGFILLFFTYLCFSIAMIVGLLCFNQTGVYVMMFLVGISSAGINTLPWALLSTQFGRHNLSPIMCGFWCIGALIILLMQAFIGFSYDREILPVESSDRFCRGVNCFRNSLLMFLCLLISIPIVQTVNLVMLLRKGKNNWVLGQPS